MKKLFSTSDLPPALRFRRWRELIVERLAPVELRPVGDQPFAGTLEGGDLGALQITRITQTAMETACTPDTLRHQNKRDTVAVILVLDGVVSTIQHDRAAVQRAGDLVVLGHHPSLLHTWAPCQALIIEVPRISLEAAMGRVSSFASLTIGAEQPTTRLAASFFRDVAAASERLCPDTVPRLAAAGIDLLIASIAERLARDAPEHARSTCIIERAVACVRENAGNPSLDPARVAAAAGVSLRGLQVLFRERGWHVSDCIWHRRLESAATRLASAADAHTPIGTIAHQCGFTTQSHFARRFKEHYGLSPVEYRERSLLRRPPA